MIIIIDNNIVSALAFQAKLNEMHYSTLVVHDAYAALRVCAGFQRDIELVFINIRMPDLDGIELIKYIKQINRKIPFVGYAERPNKEMVQKCKKTGYNGFLQKPITYERLYSFLRQFVSTKNQQGYNCILDN